MIKNPWKQARELNALLDMKDAELARERRVSFTLTVALHNVVACDTPRANASVKRCVRIAHDALRSIR